MMLAGHTSRAPRMLGPSTIQVCILTREEDKFLTALYRNWYLFAVSQLRSPTQCRCLGMGQLGEWEVTLLSCEGERDSRTPSQGANIC